MPRSDGAVQPIAEITETRNDIFVGVEAPVHDWRVDGHLGMMPVNRGDALGSRNDAHDADARGARAAQ
jgi:hypothetical protein